MKDRISQAAELIKNANYFVVFTGAGISVESGIPPFRGENGLWTKFDPKLFDLDYFRKNPAKSWQLIRSLFYETFKTARPNRAHKALALLEKKEILKTIITQNIDNLHQMAGSKKVLEYHGTYRFLKCLQCGFKTEVNEHFLQNPPPLCPMCNGILKPDFVFFGEMIPYQVAVQSELEAQKADLMLIIGSTGEVYPAAAIPERAATYGSKIVEINIEPSNYTKHITDIFLQGKATEVMGQLLQELQIDSTL